MKLSTCLLASACLLGPISMAEAANCSAGLTAIATQIKTAKTAIASTPRVVPHRAESGWAITWNRMATASQNANAATSAPADIAPTGVEEASADQPGWANPTADTLRRAKSSWQAAYAAHKRGDDAMCRTDLADARQLLKSLS